MLPGSRYTCNFARRIQPFCTTCCLQPMHTRGTLGDSCFNNRGVQARLQMERLSSLRSLEAKLVDEKRRLGQSNEQLRAEKPSQLHLPAYADRASSGEKEVAPHPPSSPHTSLPPGPPSSPSGSPPVSPSTGLPSNASDNGEAPTAGSAPPVISSAQELERDLWRTSSQDALLTDVLADKEVSELLIQHSTGTPEQSAGRPVAAIGPPEDEQGLGIGQDPGHGLPFDLPYLIRPTRPRPRQLSNSSLALSSWTKRQHLRLPLPEQSQPYSVVFGLARATVQGRKAAASATSLALLARLDKLWLPRGRALAGRRENGKWNPAFLRHY